MKLETKIDSMIPLDWEFMDVIAFELLRDGDGFSVNSGWTLKKCADREEALSVIRGRWEVFKVNYAHKARVKDIQDIGWTASVLSLEVDCLSFVEIRKVERVITLLEKLQAIGAEIDNHFSDLYVKDSPKVRALLEQNGKIVGSDDAKPFIHAVTGETWLDLPFQFTPYWRMKNERNS